MLQDIAPHIYHNPMSFVPPAPGDLALAYAGGQVLARLEEGLLQLPRVEQCTGASGWIYGFSIDETHYYLPQGSAAPAAGLWRPAPWNGPWFAPPVAALSSLIFARL